jgi:hypothetical protein
VDFSEAVLGSAGEVEGIGGAEKMSVAGVPEELFQSLLNGLGERKPMIEAISGVIDELLQN